MGLRKFPNWNSTPVDFQRILPAIFPNGLIGPYISTSSLISPINSAPCLGHMAPVDVDFIELRECPRGCQNGGVTTVWLDHC